MVSKHWQDVRVLIDYSNCSLSYAQCIVERARSGDRFSQYAIKRAYARKARV